MHHDYIFEYLFSGPEFQCRIAGIGHNFIDSHRSSTYNVGNSRTHLQQCLMMFSKHLHRCGMWDSCPEVLHQTDQLLPQAHTWRALSPSLYKAMSPLCCCSISRSHIQPGFNDMNLKVGLAIELYITD